MISLRYLNISNLKFVAALILAILLPTTTATALVCSQPMDRTLGGRFVDGINSARIESEFLLDPRLNTFDVDVDVVGGVAYVYGYVSSEEERDRALKIAKDTAGIKGAVDVLIVDPNYKAKPTAERTARQGLKDFWTARTIKTELLASPRVRGTSVGVEVHDDVVMLKGSVGDLLQKEAAEEIAAKAAGVKTVRNDIIVVC